MDLEGRSAIVTGGAGGLGAATVRRLVDAGMGVVVFDRFHGGAAALAETLGASAIAVGGDATDPDDVGRAVDAARSLGPLSLVVNVAGGGAAGNGPMVARDGTPHALDAFTETMAMNATTAFNVTRLAAAAMAANDADGHGQRGVIVNTASIAGYDGLAGGVAYAAAKAAVLGMTLPLARDLASIGVRVCAIAPGVFDTALLRSLPEEVVDAVGGAVILPRRLGDPAEFALLVEAIATNPYMNGENVRLDGALRMAPG